MKRNSALTFLMLAVLFSLYHKGLAADLKAFHIPQISGISIDGSSKDWGNRGFCVDLLTSPDGRIHPVKDFDVTFRLGWDREGLLVLVFVHDDVFLEHENPSRLWQRDCVELFISQYAGSSNRHQVVIASGADPNFRSVRQRIYDWRPEARKTRKLTAQTASRVMGNGSIVEVRVPWDNIGATPDLGMELGFQLVANDDDGAEDSNGPLRVAWYPSVGPGSPLGMYSLKLSDSPSESTDFRIRRKITQNLYSVSILGTENWIGQPVTLKTLDKTIAQGKMEERSGRTGQIFELDAKTSPDFWPDIEVILGGRMVRKYEEVPTLNTILNRYMDAVGGREAIARLTSRVGVGWLVDDLTWQDPQIESYALKAYAKIPDRWVTIIQTAKGSERNGFDGSVGWKLDVDRIERDDSARRSWLGFFLNPQGILHIEHYFPELELEGITRLDRQEVYVVQTSSGDGNQNKLYFDTETGLLIQIGIYWEIKDYRESDGIKFPFRIAISRKGGESYFAFDKIEHNVSIDETLFSIPDHAAVFAGAFEGLEKSRVLPLLKCNGLTYAHEDMNVPVKDGRFLHDFIVEHGYQRGLEIGTFTGYSTLWMGLGFQKTHGELITIEIDSSYGEVAQENIAKAGLDDVVESRIDDALKEIPKIEGTFDFIFIDARKPDYLKYLNLLRGRVRVGGAIIAHNVTNYARDMQDFLDAIRNDPGLETTFNEISGEGMSISIVRK